MQPNQSRIYQIKQCQGPTLKWKIFFLVFAYIWRESGAEIANFPNGAPCYARKFNPEQ